MLSVDIRISPPGSRETFMGNSLKPTTGRHSPMAGKPRDARIDPEQLNHIEPFLRLGLNGFYNLLQVVAT